jgi:hypothetical protein
MGSALVELSTNWLPWQTQRSQKPPGATPCEFASHPRHQLSEYGIGLDRASEGTSTQHLTPKLTPIGEGGGTPGDHPPSRQVRFNRRARPREAGGPERRHALRPYPGDRRHEHREQARAPAARPLHLCSRRGAIGVCR